MKSEHHYIIDFEEGFFNQVQIRRVWWQIFNAYTLKLSKLEHML